MLLVLFSWPWADDNPATREITSNKEKATYFLFKHIPPFYILANLAMGFYRHLPIVAPTLGFLFINFSPDAAKSSPVWFKACQTIFHLYILDLLLYQIIQYIGAIMA
jgi:hypothetical protein